MGDEELWWDRGWAGWVVAGLKGRLDAAGIWSFPTVCLSIRIHIHIAPPFLPFFLLSTTLAVSDDLQWVVLGHGILHLAARKVRSGQTQM